MGMDWWWEQVVDSKRVTPAGRRDADEPEGNRREVASIAAAVLGSRPRGMQADDHQWDSEAVQFGSVSRSLLED